ncbi:MAG: DnaJ domain-containing protein [Spirochaetota bacterium]
MKKKNDYLRVFGLREPFTEDELSGAYRALAKLNHPDVNDDPAAEMRMVILNEGYGFLRDYISEGDIRTDISGEDIDYRLYREAVDIIRDGFDAYYAGSLSADRLKNFLIRAKEKLSRIVRYHEESDWYSDSIDRICSINKWLD